MRLFWLQALGRTRVIPGNGSMPLRGVFSIEPEADLKGAIVFLETQHPSLTLNFDAPKVYLASDLSDPSVVPKVPPEVLDIYQPCTIDPKHGYTVVYEVDGPSNQSASDQLSVEMCSKGGYDQVIDPLAAAAVSGKRGIFMDEIMEAVICMYRSSTCESR